VRPAHAASPRFVAISGNIGVGKTTLVSWLADTYGIRPIYEPFETNPYLDDFYADMGKWAFHSQVWFLSHKFRLHQELAQETGTIVQDRTIYEDAEIFATHLGRSGRMIARDLETYLELYRSMRRSLRPPDLMIWLRCGVPGIRKRIRQRGRPSELAIPPGYLKALNALYEEWMGGWRDCPVIPWDTEAQDWLGDLVHRLEFQRAIERFL
jgi:deoxyadenosine/deoxycytidine kinase